MEEAEGGTVEETASEDTSAEVEASESASDESSGSETPESDSGEPAQDDEPDSWKFLLGKAKVQGDLTREAKEAIGKEHAQLKTAASDLSRENKRLAAKLAEVERSARTPKDEPEEVPVDLQDAESKVKAFEDESKALPQQLNVLAQALDTAYKARIKAELAVENADEIDKAAAEARLSTAEARFERAQDKYLSAEERARTIQRDIQQARKERDGVKRQIESEKARQARANEETQRFNEEFPEEIDGIITKTADALGLPKDEKYRHAMWAHVNEALMVEFWRLRDTPVEDVNIPALVEAKVKRFVNSGELHSRFKLQRTSKDKLGVTAPSNGQSRPNQAVTPPRPPPKPLESWRDAPHVKAAKARLGKLGL